MSNKKYDKISGVWVTNYDYSIFHLEGKKGFYILYDKIELAPNSKVEVIGLEIIIDESSTSLHKDPLILMVEEMIIYGTKIHKIENYRLKSSRANLAENIQRLLDYSLPISTAN